MEWSNTRAGTAPPYWNACYLLGQHLIVHPSITITQNDGDISLWKVVVKFDPWIEIELIESLA